MPDRSDLIYRYNGELPGLLCCVFESRRTGRLPLNIWEEWEPCTSLAPELTIPASREEAAQVWRSLRRLSPTGAHWVEVSFLSGEEGKAMDLHDFVWETFERGQDITGFLGDPVVARVFGLQRQVHNEAHLFLEFLRFREQQGVLCAQIEPKSFVLPLMGGHFAARFPGEAFLIHDITHGAALLHQGGRMEIYPLEELSLDALSPAEEEYQQLWQRYYDTIAIRERYNPKCRMGHCPKRFWKHMLEMEGPGRRGNPAPRGIPAARTVAQKGLCPG
ncbi:MAG: DNA metabolism protein [Angelakisella sp.]|jgi:probable DNA metabolism protein|nr:DNA metabolism protein [Angelakisella sp.]